MWNFKQNIFILCPTLTDDTDNLTLFAFCLPLIGPTVELFVKIIVTMVPILRLELLIKHA